jgi:pimeloyl-ACP methyl ester carboxylesterase
MIRSHSRLRVVAFAGAVMLTGSVAVAPSALAAPVAPRALQWRSCGGGFQCARISVPRDYARPRGVRLRLPVVRLPARRSSGRIGSLFINFGGPGDATTQTLRGIGRNAFRRLNQRYDIIGLDPRGTGGTDAIDCKANPETTGQIAQPFPRPTTVQRDVLIAGYRTYIRRCLALNPRILPYVTTANTARDMDRVREALGEPAIAYLGFSYGTFLGTTYESMFPGRVARFVLDGAVDPDAYMRRPVEFAREQTGGFETALGRFFQACAAHRSACRFGGDDPWGAFDRLVAAMNTSPLPVRGSDPRRADGDDMLIGAAAALYAKAAWPLLAQALAQAARGDGTGARRLADQLYLRRPDGTYDPLNDRFFAIASLEPTFARSLGDYLRRGADDFALFPHFWWNSGYYELAARLWPVQPRGTYRGPFSAPASAPPTLVVGTTYDPATPYADAVRLTARLGNARLLTMRGDGHGAYLLGGSPCIDRTVEAYLVAGAVPAAGAACAQRVRFRRPSRAAGARAARLVGAAVRMR